MLGLIIFVFAGWGCTFFDRDDQALSFIRINEASLEPTANSGFPSHKITDAWVYVDQQLIGVFPIPSTVPVYTNESQDKDIMIGPGVKPNGLNSNSIEYPFYERLKINTKLKASDTLLANLKTRFSSISKFDIVEDFEVSNSFTQELDGNLDTKVERVLDSSNGGRYVGRILLDSKNTDLEVAHNLEFLGINNKQGKVFFELDYKSNELFFVGVILRQGTTFAKSYQLGIAPSNTWNRIYVDLTELISKQTVEGYKIVLAAKVSNSTASNREILIDNIKLVHF
jgi:hypothetical protein